MPALVPRTKNRSKPLCLNFLIIIFHCQSFFSSRESGFISMVISVINIVFSPFLRKCFLPIIFVRRNKSKLLSLSYYSDYNGFRGGSRTCPQTNPAERAGLSFVPQVQALCPGFKLCGLCAPFVSFVVKKVRRRADFRPPLKAL